MVLLSAALLLGGAGTAHGQIDASVAAGGGIAVYYPSDEDARRSTGFALTYRFGKFTGLRPTFGLNWYSTEFDGDIGGERTALGRLRIRPLMVGYSYGVRRDRWTASAGLVGGYAFNSFALDDRARLAYQSQLQRTLLRASASNSAAARAEVSVWYDLNSRLGLQAVVGYVVARPRVTLIDEAGTTRRSLPADAVKLQIGVGYAIF